MEQVKETALKKAIVLLNAIGAQYAIIDSDGNHHGELQIEKKSKRSKSKYQWGELTNYCRENFTNLGIGDVLIFPVDKYPIADMQRTLSSWICKNYGNGSHTTCVNRERNAIEVLRIA